MDVLKGLKYLAVCELATNRAICDKEEELEIEAGNCFVDSSRNIVIAGQSMNLKLLLPNTQSDCILMLLPSSSSEQRRNCDMSTSRR